jgi:hypothetical protein
MKALLISVFFSACCAHPTSKKEVADVDVKVFFIDGTEEVLKVNTVVESYKALSLDEDGVLYYMRPNEDCSCASYRVLATGVKHFKSIIQK